MSYQEKSLQCPDRGLTSAPGVDDRESIRSEGCTDAPTRCPESQGPRKSERSSNNSRGVPRKVFPATCARCGRSTEVSFQPRGDSPVYCSDCYRMSQRSSVNFEVFNFHPSVMAGVRAVGYSVPTPVQSKAIPLIMQGRDVIGLAQTGTGKTAAFVLPILERLGSGPQGCVRALII